MHPHRTDHVVLAEHHAIEVNHQQIHLIKRRSSNSFSASSLASAASRLTLDFITRSTPSPAHLGILSRRDPAHQHIQHPLAQPIFLHGFVSRDRHFAAALLPQPRLTMPSLRSRRHATRLPTVPQQLWASLPGVRGPANCSADNCSTVSSWLARYVDQFIDRQPRCSIRSTSGSKPCPLRLKNSASPRVFVGPLW